MPELPEVETLRRELTRVLVGQVIKSVKVLWPKSVTPKDFVRQLKGLKILAVNRRAKILLFDLTDNKTLAIHLKMTGQLVYQGSTLSHPKVEPLIVGGHPEDPTKYTRAIFEFENDAKLYFNDLRKFGWLKLLPPTAKRMLVSKHGVEPLTQKFTLARFSNLLARYPRRRLKQMLLDQTLIAGLGNIYADESCFAARIRPTRRSKTLTVPEIKKLHRATKQVLRLAIRKGGTSIRDYRRSDGSRGGFAALLKVYGRAGRPCRSCQTPIAKIKLAGRGTHFCPRCQK